MSTEPVLPLPQAFDSAREADTVARLGGDEFVVLLETDVRPDTPGITGERIRAGFDSPFDWKGTEVRCGASIGVSLYPAYVQGRFFGTKPS